jgi:hypothetical protein
LHAAAGDARDRLVNAAKNGGLLARAAAVWKRVVAKRELRTHEELIVSV